MANSKPEDPGILNGMYNEFFVLFLQIN